MHAVEDLKDALGRLVELPVADKAVDAPPEQVTGVTWGDPSGGVSYADIVLGPMPERPPGKRPHGNRSVGRSEGVNFRLTV